MKVLILNDFAFVNGGSSMVALSSAAGLASRGVDVLLFSAVGPADPGLSEKGVVVTVSGRHDILSDPVRARAAAQGVWNFKTGVAFKEVLRSYSPVDTVVHVHSWIKALSPSVISAALENGFPLVMTLHDYFYACPNGAFFNYRKALACDLRPMGPRCILADCDSRRFLHKSWRVVRHAAQTKTLGSVRNFIFVSNSSRNILAPHMPDGARTWTLPGPVDVPDLPPAGADGNTEVVFVGRLSVEKGPHLYAEGCRLAGIKPVFVGDGPLKSVLKSGFPEAEFTGWLPREAVMERIRNARALVFPSLCRETFGLVVAEAAAVGVPSIVAEDSAACDLVSDGENGLLFKCGNSRDLAEKILLVTRDTGLASKLGSEALKRYKKQCLTPSQHVDGLMKIYGDILA